VQFEFQREAYSEGAAEVVRKRSNGGGGWFYSISRSYLKSSKPEALKRN